MSGFIQQNQNTMTFAQAQTEVARVLGNAGDSDQESLAGDAITNVLRDLNAKREWRWLQINVTGTVNTDGLITLPSRLKKIYSLVVNNRTLQYVEERDWVRQVDLQQNIGYTGYYTTFGTAGTNKIEVRDHPGSPQTYSLDYLSLITIAYSPTTLVIDVPENIMAYILSQSKADYVASVDAESPKAAFFYKQAQQRYFDIVREDVAEPDAEASFTPGYLFPNFVYSNIDPDFLGRIG